VKKVQRVTLGTASGAANFVAQHPSPEPNVRAIEARLVARAEAFVALTQAEVEIEARKVAGQRLEQEAGQSLRQAYLPAVAVLADSAWASDPARARQFHVRKKDGRSRIVFIATVGNLLDEVRGAEAELLAEGMPPTLPASLEALLAQFSEGVETIRRARFEAAELRVAYRQAAAATVAVLRQLDALYRLRFQDDPAAWAAWQSVRNIPWPGTTLRRERRQARRAAAPADAESQAPKC